MLFSSSVAFSAKRLEVTKPLLLLLVVAVTKNIFRRCDHNLIYCLTITPLLLLAVVFLRVDDDDDGRKLDEQQRVDVILSKRRLQLLLIVVVLDVKKK